MISAISQITNVLEDISASTLAEPWSKISAALEHYPPDSPRNIENVADYLGVIICWSAELPPLASACLIPMNNTQLIVVNSQRSLLHQKISIAHELVHHLLDHTGAEIQTELTEDFQATVLGFYLLLRIEEIGDPSEVLEHNKDVFICCFFTLLAAGALLIGKGIVGLHSWRQTRQGRKHEGRISELQF